MKLNLQGETEKTQAIVNTRLEDEENKKRRDECKYGPIRLRSQRANEDRAAKTEVGFQKVQDSKILL